MERNPSDSADYRRGLRDGLRLSRKLIREGERCVPSVERPSRFWHWLKVGYVGYLIATALGLVGVLLVGLWAGWLYL